MAQQVIVLGGGLAGMSAAHSVVQAGGRVLVLDKSPFCGGNSTKATSGINAAGTRSQVCGEPLDACLQAAPMFLDRPTCFLSSLLCFIAKLRLHCDMEA